MDRRWCTAAELDQLEPPMSNAVKFLSDDALVKVSAYYASLDPAQPATASAKAAPVRPDPVAARPARASATGWWTGCTSSMR